MKRALVMRNLIFIFLPVVFMSRAALCSESNLNVVLYVGQQAQIGSPSDIEISNRSFSSGSYVFTNRNGHLNMNDQDFGREASIVSSTPFYFLSLNQKPYRGKLLLYATSEGIQVVNQVTVEEYLYGVVAKEMPGAELEALKAQAVASRTLAANAALRATPIYATVSHQIYGGVIGENPIGRQAVDDTRGLVLTYQGNLVQSPLFSSTCGGKTDDSKDVFGKGMPYLQSVSDNDASQETSYCAISPYYQWTVTWSPIDLQVMMEPYGVHGQLENIVLSEIDENGRVKKILVRTAQGEWEFKGETIRNVLRQPSGKPLFSTWFTINKMEQDGKVSFIATGKGEGHGVGLCQWGAIGMARSGKSFQDILAHYYVGTALSDFATLAIKGSRALSARHH